LIWLRFSGVWDSVGALFFSAVAEGFPVSNGYVAVWVRFSYRGVLEASLWLTQVGRVVYVTSGRVGFVAGEALVGRPEAPGPGYRVVFFGLRGGAGCVRLGWVGFSVIVGWLGVWGLYCFGVGVLVAGCVVCGLGLGAVRPSGKLSSIVRLPLCVCWGRGAVVVVSGGGCGCVMLWCFFFSS